MSASVILVLELQGSTYQVGLHPGRGDLMRSVIGTGQSLLPRQQRHPDLLGVVWPFNLNSKRVWM